MRQSLRSLPLIIVMAAAGLLYGCTPDRLLDADQLERQLLVVWIALERDDAAVARSETAAATRSWAELRTDYSQILTTEQERKILQRIDLWMIGLRNAVNDAPPQRTIMYLRQLQNHLTDLRPRYGMEHPTDLLYTFNRQWEWVDEISQDQMMCLLEWGEYAVAYRQARDSWERFQSIPPVFSSTTLPGRVNLSAATESAALRLTNALDDFERLLVEANHGPMATAAAHVQSEFFHFLATAVEYPAEVAAR